MHVRAVHVVVPAHDEQAVIGACLTALRRCVESTPVPVSLTVVADSCRDGTAALVRGRAELVEVDHRTVGRARAAGFASALAHDPGPAVLDGLWFATTDADTLVPPTWLTTQIRLAAAGADVVAGTVSVQQWSGWSPLLTARYDRGYARPEGEPHGHVHGANLGFSARTYLALGGFAPLATGEDVDLVRRATASGARVAWETADPVTTSSRRDARAPDGFSGHLCALDAATTGPVAGAPAGGGA